MEKPSIVETIGQYLPLRRAGQEYAACCPFHEDKHPSFYVNEDKGVFLCRGCGEHGDVIDFLQKWSGKTFKEVTQYYGLHGNRRRIVPDDAQIAARKIRQWVYEFSLMLAGELREIGQRAMLAKEIAWLEELQYLHRKWAILSMLHDDIHNPDYILDLYQEREALESWIQCPTL